MPHWSSSELLRLNDLGDVFHSAIDEGSHVMFKASWMVLLPIGILLAAESPAEDSIAAETGSEEIPLQTRIATTADAEWEFSYLWNVRYPVALTTFPEAWPGAMGEFDFQDTSIFGRYSQLRNL